MNRATLLMTIASALCFAGFMWLQIAGLAWASIALNAACVVLTAWTVIMSAPRSRW